MKRALMFASVASMIDQFNMENIHILKSLGYEVDVACNFEFGSSTSKERVNEFRKELEKNSINTYHIDVPRKISAIRGLIESYKKFNKLLDKNRYDIVHCHSPIGGVIARLCCKKYRELGTKIVYTAHGFHFFKGASIKNWILFYPIERLLARYTDVLITINQEDYKRAKKFKAKKIMYIPGVGVDTKKISEINVDKSAKRKELGLPEKAFVVISVGELNKNKNHETIIKSIAKLNNPNVYYVICGKGILIDYLKNLIKKLNLENQVKLLGYRNDIKEISIVSDLFAFASFREGLPVAMMEAMCIGLPVICSNIRGNSDLIKNGQGGYLIKPNDVDGFANKINEILENFILKESMGKKNRKEIIKYNLNIVKKDMEKIYLNLN